MSYLKLFCMKNNCWKIKTLLVLMYKKNKCDLLFNKKYLKTSKMIWR
jgi:hypothetical protein